MKYLDIVELITEREEYALEGVHKGMIGAIMMEEKLGDTWYVIFTETGTGKDIADIPVREEDLRVLDRWPDADPK